MNKLRATRIALVLAVLLIAVPAIADHITEPTSPITMYTMEVYSYPNFSTRLVACDGTEVLKNVDGTIAKDLRFETFVDYEARTLGNPSEHWDETVTLFVVRNLGRNNESEQYEWRVKWRHSNIGPHQQNGVSSNGPESSQNAQNMRAYPAGTILRLRGDLNALESGQALVAECTFKVG